MVRMSSTAVASAGHHVAGGAGAHHRRLEGRRAQPRVRRPQLGGVERHQVAGQHERGVLGAAALAACAAWQPCPRAASSRTSSPFCATATSRPVGSPKTAPAAARRARASSASTRCVPVPRVSSPSTSARPRSNGSGSPRERQERRHHRRHRRLGVVAAEAVDAAVDSTAAANGSRRPAGARRHGVEVGVEQQQRPALPRRSRQQRLPRGEQRVAQPPRRAQRRRARQSKLSSRAALAASLARDRRDRHQLPVQRQQLGAARITHAFTARAGSRGLLGRASAPPARPPPACRSPRW